MLKMKKYLNKSTIITCLFLLLFSGLIITFFSSSTSPLYEIKDYGDSVIFQTIGKWWAQGVIPYSQLWDLKGPYLYFVNALGYFVADNSTGLALLQIMNLFVVEMVIYKLFRIRFTKKISLCLNMIATVYLSFNLQEWNTAEEYVLPFLLVSALFQFKWLDSLSKITRHNYWHGFFYGITLAICVLTRITNYVPIGIGVVIITIYLLYKKQWKNLFQNAIMFVLGLIILCLPFCFYFYIKESFYDLIYGTLIYNVGYASQSVFEWRPTNFAEAASLVGAWGTIIISVCCLIWNKNKYQKFSALFWLLASAITYFWLLRCLNFRHYAAILLPCFCITFLIFKDIPYSKKNRIKTIGIYSLLISIVCFSCLGIPSMLKNICSKLQNNTYININENNLEIMTRELVNQIPLEERNSFIAYDCYPGLYLQMDICPCYRCFKQQTFEISQNETLLDLINEDFSSNRAEWILVVNPENTYINRFLDNYYVYNTLKLSHDGETLLCLYRLKK